MRKKYKPLLSVVMLTILLILSVTAIASNQNLRRKNLSLRESLEAAVLREETHVCPVVVVEDPEPTGVEAPGQTEKTTPVKVQADGLARLDDVTVSHYDVCLSCCGSLNGITASGRSAEPYFSVAVDPSIIPLGSRVVLDFGDGDILYCRADDTGSAVQGRKVDLCVESHEEALRLGLRTATVWYGPWEDAK